jgi:hypothetical protein
MTMRLYILGVALGALIGLGLGRFSIRANLEIHAGYSNPPTAPPPEAPGTSERNGNPGLRDPHPASGDEEPGEHRPNADPAIRLLRAAGSTLSAS